MYKPHPQSEESTSAGATGQPLFPQCLDGGGNQGADAGAPDCPVLAGPRTTPSAATITCAPARIATGTRSVIRTVMPPGSVRSTRAEKTHGFASRRRTIVEDEAQSTFVRSVRPAIVATWSLVRCRLPVTRSECMAKIWEVVTQ